MRRHKIEASVTASSAVVDEQTGMAVEQIEINPWGIGRDIACQLTSEGIP
jgi:methylglyoxal synthase